MQHKLVVGNWKMYGSLALAENLSQNLKEALASNPAVDVVLCPPLVYLATVANLIKGTQISLGAQNLYFEPKGAFTGEISPYMLTDLGCKYVIIGHSERRNVFLENDELVAKKCAAAYHAGLIPILCLGETQVEREKAQTLEVVTRQLKAVLKELPIEAFKKMVVAYEPVWAIGTGVTAKPSDAQIVHEMIRDFIAATDIDIAQGVRILYGGGVKPVNAASLLKEPDIDGVLVGAASVEAHTFLQICNIAAKLG